MIDFAVFQMLGIVVNLTGLFWDVLSYFLSQPLFLAFYHFPYW